MVVDRLKRALRSSPAAYRAARGGYRLARFVFAGGLGARAAAAGGVRLLTPHAWAGIDDDGASYFFGYHHQSPWSPDGSAALLHRVGGDGRVELVLLDRERAQMRVLAPVRAWNRQLGSMACWISRGHEACVIHNELRDSALGCVIRSASGRELARLDRPLNALRPDGGEILSVNYPALDEIGCEYGYALDAANMPRRPDPRDDGLWRVPTDGGAAQLCISTAAAAALCGADLADGGVHFLNHGLYSPDGGRFVCIFRSIGPEGRLSRLLFHDGEKAAMLMGGEYAVSHFCWLDGRRVLVTSGQPCADGLCYHVLDTETGRIAPSGVAGFESLGDGHPGLRADGVGVTDTYPGAHRRQSLVLFGWPGGNTRTACRLYSPWRFEGARRCDLHPRLHPFDNMVCVDSAHTGRRRAWFVDFSGLTGLRG